MKTKTTYLTKGMAAAALALLVASCNKMEFAQTPQISSEEIKANAEQALGVTIDPNQTWVMTQNVTASIAVNGDYGTENTAIVYQNNPTIDNTGIVLGKATVESGSTATFSFTVAKGTTLVYAAVRDHKGYTYVKPAVINDGKLTASFGEETTRAARRSSTNSSVNIPTGTARTTVEAQAAEILAKSVELTEDNNNQDAVGYYWRNSDTDKGIVKYDNYVINYKISGTYEGLVNKLGSAGHIWGDWVQVDGQWKPEDTVVPRTVYVSGKWTIPANQYQSCGNGYTGVGVDGIIIVGPNAELQVNGTLNFANQARLIVLGNGKVTGTGTININNGSASGEESYNYGTITVKQFNENFGNFFNYGVLASETLIGGAGTSCFVNHGRIQIKEAYGNSGSAANLQIKNNCWFEASGDVACKILENGAGAYLKCNNLSMSGGEGGENLGSYMSIDAGSRVYVVNDLKGNGTSIVGPTSGNYAYICVGGHVTQWVWNGYTAYPTVRHEGMIINNIYIYATPDSNTEWNWTHMINEKVMETNPDWCTSWGNKIGNNHVTLLTTLDGYNTATTEASDCAPAFSPSNPNPVIETHPISCYAFEDTSLGDYDMNDVVIKAQLSDDETKINLTLVAVGATLDLTIRLYPAASLVGDEVAHYPTAEEGYTTLSNANGEEVHAMLGVSSGTMVNTGTGKTATPITISIPKGNYDPAHLPLAIYSTSQGEMRLAGAGEAPFGVIVPGDWAWPRERVNITTAYNEVETESDGDQSFATFAHNANKAMKWHQYPSGNVMK